jgi:hypothetical protein
VLTNTGRVIVHSTVQPISDANIKTEQVIWDLKAFDESIQTKLSSESDSSEDIDVPDYLRYMSDKMTKKSRPHIMIMLNQRRQCPKPTNLTVKNMIST